MKKFIGAPFPCVYRPVSSLLKTECPDVRSSALSVLKKLTQIVFCKIHFTSSPLFDNAVWPIILWIDHNALHFSEGADSWSPLCVLSFEANVKPYLHFPIPRHRIGPDKCFIMHNNNPLMEPPTMLLVPIRRDMQLWWDIPPIPSPRKAMPTETCFDDVGRIMRICAQVSNKSRTTPVWQLGHVYRCIHKTERHGNNNDDNMKIIRIIISKIITATIISITIMTLSFNYGYYWRNGCPEDWTSRFVNWLPFVLGHLRGLRLIEAIYQFSLEKKWIQNSVERIWLAVYMLVYFVISDKVITG